EVDRAPRLLRGLLDVVHVEHGDALETVGIGLAEVRDPVVIDAGDGREQGAGREAGPEEPPARLQARAPHPPHPVLFDHRLWVVRAESDVSPPPKKIDLRRVLESL